MCTQFPFGCTFSEPSYMWITPRNMNGYIVLVSFKLFMPILMEQALINGRSSAFSMGRKDGSIQL